MIGQVSRVMLVAVFGFVISVPAMGEEPITNSESKVVMSRLLGLYDKPDDNQEELARYKEWMGAYAHAKQRAMRGDVRVENLKVYLFVVFVAHQTVSVHTEEEIAKDIVLIYENRPALFRQALEESPFLIATACSAFDDHSSLYGVDGELGESANKVVDDFRRMVKDVGKSGTYCSSPQ